MTKKIFLFGALILFLAYVKTHGASFNMVQVGSTNNPGRITSSGVIVTNADIYAGSLFASNQVLFPLGASSGLVWQALSTSGKGGWVFNNGANAITNIASFNGSGALLNYGVSNNVAYFKDLFAGTGMYLVDTGTNLIFNVTNLNLSAGGTLFTGILPSTNLGTGVQDGSTFLNSTGGWVTVSGSGDAVLAAANQNWATTGTNTFGILKTQNGIVADANNTMTMTNKTLASVTVNGLKLAFSSGSAGGGAFTNATFAVGTLSSRMLTVTGTVDNILTSGSANEGPYTFFFAQQGGFAVSNWSSTFYFPQGTNPYIDQTANTTNPLVFWGSPNVGAKLWYTGPSDTFPFLTTFSNPTLNNPWTNSSRRAQVIAYLNLTPSTTNSAQAELWIISQGQNAATNKLGPVIAPTNTGLSCHSLLANLSPSQIALITNTSIGTATVTITNSQIVNW